jgi:hypothetical protein
MAGQTEPGSDKGHSGRASILWPSFVLILGFVFRRPLRSLLKRIDEFELPRGKAKHDRSIDRIVASNAEALEQDNVEPLVLQLTAQNPRVGLVALREALQDQVALIVARLGIASEGWAQNVHRLDAALDGEGNIEAVLTDIFSIPQDLSGPRMTRIINVGLAAYRELVRSTPAAAPSGAGTSGSAQIQIHIDP